MIPDRNVMIEIEEVQNYVEGEDWPVIFPVCTKHKKDFFMDYAVAIVRDNQPCVLCLPRDNDSLGG